jgi:hypothetical protein
MLLLVFKVICYIWLIQIGLALVGWLLDCMFNK